MTQASIRLIHVGVLSFIAAAFTAHIEPSIAAQGGKDSAPSRSQRVMAIGSQAPTQPAPPQSAQVVSAQQASTKSVDSDRFDKAFEATLETSKRTVEAIDKVATWLGGAIGLLGAFIGFMGWSTISGARKTEREAQKRLKRLKELEDGAQEVHKKISEQLTTAIMESAARTLAYSAKIAEAEGAKAVLEQRDANADPAGWKAQAEKALNLFAESDAMAQKASDLAAQPSLQQARSYSLAEQAMLLFSLGRYAEALSFARKSCESNPAGRPDRHYNAACIMAALITSEPNGNHNTNAIEQLKSCLQLAELEGQSGFGLEVWINDIESDADLEAVRGEALTALIAEWKTVAAAVRAGTRTIPSPW